MSYITMASETDPTVGAQLPPSINPFEAIQDQDNATSLYNKEMAEFNSLAEQSAGLALLYFTLVLCNTVLNYQGSQMEIESSLMDTVSLLNNDLDKINSDITSVFEDLEGGDSSSSSQVEADVGQFVKDTAQYAVDLNCYFYGGGTLKSGEQVSPPFENDDFASAIASDFDVFQVTANINGKSTTESLFDVFQAAANGDTVDWTGVTNSLATQFSNAYSGAANGGDSSGMKEIEDVITNAETQQNQINSTASTDLSADQQTYNSYESTLKNSLSMIITLEKSANSHMAQASS